MATVPNLKYKTSLCNAWKDGLDCQKGAFCFFAHGQSELRTMEQNRQLLAVSPNSVPQPAHNFKTSYCKFYSKGDCKLGDACSFAHSKAEKRQKMYLPKQQNPSPPDAYWVAYNHYDNWCPYYPEQVYYPYVQQQGPVGQGSLVMEQQSIQFKPEPTQESSWQEPKKEEDIRDRQDTAHSRDEGTE